MSSKKEDATSLRGLNLVSPRGMLNKSGDTARSTNKLPPTEKEKARVDAEFLEMLKQQGIPQAGAAKMATSLDYDGKVKMIEQSQAKQHTAKKTMKTPAWFVAQLKAGPDVDTLRNLKVYLKTESVTWLRSFNEGHGLTQLTSYLVGLEQQRNTGDASKTKECIFECCCIVDAVAREDEGLRMLMDPSLDQLLKVMFLCLDTTDSRRLIVLFTYFALLCQYSPVFYQRVVDGFHYFKTVKREPMNYFQLVETLKGAVSKELACKCMTLINSLITTSDDLDTRVSQRTAFLRLGIRQAILDVKTRLSDEEFDAQFAAFVDDEKEDQQQLQEIGLSSNSLSITGDVGNISGRNLAQMAQESDVANAALSSILDSLQSFPTRKGDKNAARLWTLAAALMEQLASGKSVLNVGNDVVVDQTELMRQMDYRSELAVKEKDFRALEQDLRLQLKKATAELNDAKQELSFLRERQGSGSNVVHTPLMRPKEYSRRDSETVIATEENPEEKKAKHRLQEEELFRLKQKVGESGSLEQAVTADSERVRKAELEMKALQTENARLTTALAQAKASAEAEKQRAKLAEERAQAVAVTGSGGFESSAAPPPPPPPGGDFAPPPPPPPPGGGGFAPPPPPPPGGDFAPPPPPPPPPGGGPPPPPPPPGGGPPPPPPPPGGGPPPPPPPPGGGPPPPPPPGGGPPPPPGFNTRAAPVATAWKSPLPKPQVKMRVLNWQKMPNTKAEKTLFFQMKDELTQVQLDFGELQDMFRQPEDKGAADKSAGGPTEPAKPVAVTLIGPKRTQSVNIFLKSCRMTAAEMMVALNKYDQSVCTLEFLERLLENIPTQEEISSIDAYLEGGGDAHLLAEPEKFFRDIHTVKGLKLKVQAYITLQKFPEQLASVKPQIETVRTALEQLKTSTKWKSIVRLVLAIGNYINGSSTRGDAMGFKLDSLNKLRDTKTTDNKSNLLNYLVATLEKNEPATLLVSEELKSVEAAKRVSFQSCSEDIQALTKACANIEAAAQVVVDDPNDKFKQFVTDATARTFRGHLNTVVGELQAAEAQYKELATSYGEDPATMPSGEFLGIVDTFLQSMLTARKEIEATRVKAAKAAAAAVVKAKTGGKSSASHDAGAPETHTLRETSGAAAPKGVTPQPGQALVVDELLQGLKSGALLKARTENRREERIRRTPNPVRKEVNEPPPWMAGRGRGLGRGSPAKSEQARLEKSLGLAPGTPASPVLPVEDFPAFELGDEVQSTPTAAKASPPAPAASKNDSDEEDKSDSDD